MARRDIERMIIVPALAMIVIAIGFWLVPETFVWKASADALPALGGWGFLGLFLIGTGLFHLVKTLVFARRAGGSAGEWHFRLTGDELLWHVPDHAHGPETGFKAKLSEIKGLEYKLISKTDALDDREYWVHFHDRDSIQLREYTGISMSWLVSKIHETGVPYTETVVEI